MILMYDEIAGLSLDNQRLSNIKGLNSAALTERGLVLRILRSKPIYSNVRSDGERFINIDGVRLTFDEWVKEDLEDGATIEYTFIIPVEIAGVFFKIKENDYEPEY